MGVVSSNTEEATRVIRALTRAAMAGNAREQLLAHRQGFQLGSRMIAPIEDMLARFDWSRPGRKEGIAIVTALALLLHDIDETASRKFFYHVLQANHVHALYAERISTVLQFTLDDYDVSMTDGTRVFTHKSLGGVEKIAERVGSWLRALPKDHSTGIERIYVVPRLQDEYWGSYLRVLSNVVVVWRGQGPINHLRTEYTFLHEIGHHIDQGQDHLNIEAEDSADAYAHMQVVSQHPFFARPIAGVVLGRIIFGPRWLRGSRAQV